MIGSVFSIPQQRAQYLLLATTASDSPEQADSEPFAFATDDDVMDGVQVYSLHRSERHFFVRWTALC